MNGANTSSLTPRYFILNGIPGLEAAHIWISMPFCLMFLTAVTGNCGLIYLIIHGEALHRPMYYFLAMLSATDISGCNTIVPSMLCIFWFSLKEIDFNACLAQMFFIHMLTGMESGVLMLMALDRYVAICYPLRYSTILTNAVITKVGLVTLIRSVLLMVPFTFLIKRLPNCRGNLITNTMITKVGLVTLIQSVLLMVPFTFLIKRLPNCRGNLIHHTYCDHMAVAKLSCGNTKINAIYGLIAAVFIGGFDMFCISMSYAMIIHVVVKLSSADARHKAFSTCTSHICAIVITYVPALFNFFTHCFGGSTIPHHVHILIANLYLLLPPTLNPIVYGIKTKQIREGVIKLFVKQKDI